MPAAVQERVQASPSRGWWRWAVVLLPAVLLFVFTIPGLNAMQCRLLGIFLAISAPFVVIAWFKLRLRNLGPILDANGWAVNTRAKLSVAFGASLTQTAALPPGSERDLRDPYSERKPYMEIVGVAVLAIVVGLGIAWYRGCFDRVLPSKMRGATVRNNLSNLIKMETKAPLNTPQTNSIPANASTNAPPGK